MRRDALRIVLALLAAAALPAQSPRTTAASATITITRAGAQSARSAPAENFTGTARVEPLFEPVAPSRTGGSIVTFEAGARTAWHTHPLGQALIVTDGTGRVQQWRGPVDEIRVGDVVWIPAGVKHWHGAAPAARMVHIGIVERLDGRSVEWMEQVSDADYAAAPRASSGDAAAPRSPVDTAAPSRAQALMGDVAPQLANLTDRVLFGEVWSRPQLSQRDRSLATISALIAMNRPDQLRSHFARARANGVTLTEVGEIITQLAFYAGWPNAIAAIAVAREVYLAK